VLDDLIAPFLILQFGFVTEHVFEENSISHTVVIVIILDHLLNSVHLVSKVVLDSAMFLSQLEEVESTELEQVVPEAREILV